MHHNCIGDNQAYRNTQDKRASHCSALSAANLKVQKEMMQMWKRLCPYLQCCGSEGAWASEMPGAPSDGRGGWHLSASGLRVHSVLNTALQICRTSLLAKRPHMHQGCAGSIQADRSTQDRRLSHAQPRANTTVIPTVGCLSLALVAHSALTTKCKNSVPQKWGRGSWMLKTCC